jgi:predicted dehydrogenase
VELAIHHLDLIRHIFGADGSAVSCLPHTPITDRLEPTTGADALIRLDTGLVINYHLSAEGTAPTTEWPGQWRISGDDAELVWGDAAVGRDPEPDLVMISTVDGSTTRLPVPLPPGLRDRAGVLREFLDAVDGRATPTSPAADNVRSIALLDALLTAAASGRTEPVLPT